MKKIFIAACLLLLGLLLTVQIVRAEDSGPELIITEIMPNPEGLDSSYEWIEIFNSSLEDIFLNDFYLDNQQLPELTLNSNQLLLLVKNKEAFLERYPDVDSDFVFELNISLKNSNDTVQITNENDDVIDEVTYTEAFEAISIVRNSVAVTDSCEFLTFSDEPSPGELAEDFCEKILEKNIRINEIYIKNNIDDEFEISIELINNEEVNIDLEAFSLVIDDLNIPIECESIDSEGFCIIETISLNPISKISLYQDDIEIDVFQKNIIRSVSLIDDELITGVIPTLGEINQFEYKIRINEIYPSPLDSESEWIELYNYGEVPIDLEGWHLIDKANQINFEILTEITLDPDTYISINTVSLNNSGDSLFLFDTYDNLVLDIEYGSVDKSKSLGLLDSDLEITKEPTPGTENIYEEKEDENIEEEIDVDETPVIKHNSTVHRYKQNDSIAQLVGRKVYVEGEIIGNFGKSFDVKTNGETFRVTLGDVEVGDKSKGDSVKLTGIVELDGEIIRIRPGSSSDVQIIRLEDLKVVSTNTDLDSEILAVGTNVDYSDTPSVLSEESYNEIPNVEFYPLEKNNDNLKDNSSNVSSESNLINNVYLLYGILGLLSFGTLYGLVVKFHEDFRNTNMVYFKKLVDTIPAAYTKK